MLELRIIAAGAAVPLFDLPAAIGKHEAARGIADTIEGLIAFLDELGGDPDTEPNGDELDGTAGEDDFYPHSNWLAQPGCPISDPDVCSAGDHGDGQATAPRKVATGPRVYPHALHPHATNQRT